AEYYLPIQGAPEGIVDVEVELLLLGGVRVEHNAHDVATDIDPLAAVEDHSIEALESPFDPTKIVMAQEKVSRNHGADRGHTLPFRNVVAMMLVERRVLNPDQRCQMAGVDLDLVVCGRCFLQQLHHDRVRPKRDNAKIENHERSKPNEQR